MWLVTDSRGTILDAHLGAQSKIAMEGMQLAAIFGEAAARELDPQGNGRCTVRFLLEDEAHRTEWRVERHVLQDGRLLILGRALGREYATLPMVPTAWERRFTRKLDPEQGDLIE